MSLTEFLAHLIHNLLGPKTERSMSRDLILGIERLGKRVQRVLLPEAARVTHLAVMGLSGVGKSYFMESLIRQDIQRETGFVVFDVHGDLADSIVAYLAEHTQHDKELRERVVIIEPFDPDFSVGFNPLECETYTSPFTQAQELAHILRTRWETKTFGPRTEELLRNALYTLSARGLTLLEMPALLVDSAFRMQTISTLTEPAVIDYWKGRYEPLSGPMKATIREPLLTRISAFLADPNIRYMVGQRESSFSFRDAIARKLWVVINLSKGRLGADSSAVLGSLLFTKLELDILAQAKLPEADRQLFAVYADELQNFAGRNLTTLIAEARKYRVSITAGHQFWKQLSPEVRAAMLGVGSHVFFRLNYHDAQELAGELSPRERQWYAEFLTTLPRGKAVFRTGANDPIEFTVRGHRKPKSNQEDIERLRSASAAHYATPRIALVQDVDARYRLRAEAAIAEQLKNRKGRPLDASSTQHSI